MGASQTTIRRRLEGKPVVVIVGGGFAGTAAAAALDNKFNVVLIDRKNYFLHNIGALRAAVVKDFSNSITIPYTNLLRHGHVVQGEVQEITPAALTVYDYPDAVTFDYLVIATGTSYGFPAKVPEYDAASVPALYEASRDAIMGASTIVIVGGGPVGVELAGEIATETHGKKIILIHPHDVLLPGPFNDQLRTRLLTNLRNLDVEVMLNERVNIDPAQSRLKYQAGPLTLTTQSGKQVPADLVFYATGAKVNSSSYRSSFSSTVDEHGRLKVDEFLRVEGCPNVFAVGDCAAVAEPKMAYTAGLQAAHVVQNIKNLAANRPLARYTTGPPAMMVPTGRNGGASQLPTKGGLVMGNMFTRAVKGHGLFVGQSWKALRARMTTEPLVLEGLVDAEDSVRMAGILKLPVEDATLLLKGLRPFEIDATVENT